MALADNFDQLGPGGELLSVLSQAQIEVLKLIKSGDFVDLNSASEGIQEVINKLEQTLASKNKVEESKNQQSEEESEEFSPDSFDKPYIEMNTIEKYTRRLVIDLYICQAMINVDWTEYQTAIDCFQ